MTKNQEACSVEKANIGDQRVTTLIMPTVIKTDMPEDNVRNEIEGVLEFWWDNRWQNNGLVIKTLYGVFKKRGGLFVRLQLIWLLCC